MDKAESLIDPQRLRQCRVQVLSPYCRGLRGFVVNFTLSNEGESAIFVVLPRQPKRVSFQSEVAPAFVVAPTMRDVVISAV